MATENCTACLMWHTYHRLPTPVKKRKRVYLRYGARTERLRRGKFGTSKLWILMCHGRPTVVGREFDSPGIERLMQVKSIKDQSPPVGMVWWFGEESASSSVVLVT
ncbi:hypothetical protein TNCV_1691491 [Trichonephila clavipes]|nr:hypothetical protein TNCV_1691491 [Trichonephila clavipes]